jgi:hypothetical protein
VAPGGRGRPPLVATAPGRPCSTVSTGYMQCCQAFLQLYYTTNIPSKLLCALKHPPRGLRLQLPPGGWAAHRSWAAAAAAARHRPPCLPLLSRCFSLPQHLLPGLCCCQKGQIAHKAGPSPGLATRRGSCAGLASRARSRCPRFQLLAPACRQLRCLLEVEPLQPPPPCLGALLPLRRLSRLRPPLLWPKALAALLQPARVPAAHRTGSLCQGSPCQVPRLQLGCQLPPA